LQAYYIFVLPNQLGILTFVTFSEGSVFIVYRSKVILLLSTVLLEVVYLVVTIFLVEHVYLLMFENIKVKLLHQTFQAPHIVQR